MNNDVLPRVDLRSVTLGYLLYALNTNGEYAQSPGWALPDATVLVENRGAVLSMTTAKPPLFRGAVTSLAATLHHDVVLLRVGDVGSDYVEVTADVSLGLLPCAMPWVMGGLEPWVSLEGELWLVPDTVSAAVSVTDEGLHLEMVAPYQTLAERCAGVLRAAREMADLPTSLGAGVRS